jgi:hypothetical protein
MIYTLARIALLCWEVFPSLILILALESSSVLVTLSELLLELGNRYPCTVVEVWVRFHTAYV